MRCRVYKTWSLVTGALAAHAWQPASTMAKGDMTVLWSGTTTYITDRLRSKSHNRSPHGQRADDCWQVQLRRRLVPGSASRWMILSNGLFKALILALTRMIICCLNHRFVTSARTSLESLAGHLTSGLSVRKSKMVAAINCRGNLALSNPICQHMDGRDDTVTVHR